MPSKALYMTTPCRCRNCGDIYEESKSRADYKGFCSSACLHEKARSLGYRKSKERPWISETTEYYFLKRAKCVGSLFVNKEGIVI